VPSGAVPAVKTPGRVILYESTNLPSETIGSLGNVAVVAVVLGLTM
jgi:hypothetical protein